MTAVAGEVAPGTLRHRADGWGAWCDDCRRGVGPCAERDARGWCRRHNTAEHAG